MTDLLPHHSLPEAFRAVVAERGSDTAYMYIDSDGTRRERSYVEVAERVNKIAFFLQSRGVTDGTRVAVISNTRPEWSETDVAIVWLGGITVSVYPSLPAHDVGVILADSGAEIVFAENEEQVEKLVSLRANPIIVAGEEESRLAIRCVVSFETVETPSCAAAVDASLDTILAGTLSDTVPIATIEPDDLASLVYTSGTTGIPKGVMQTHRNHLSNVAQAAESGAFGLDGILFLYLPLAHSFARLIHWLGLLTTARVLYTRVPSKKRSIVDLAAVSNDLRLGGAHYVPSVPRLFEKIKSQIERMSAQHSVRGFFLRLTLWAARLHTPGSPPPSLLAQIVYAGTESVRRTIRRQIFGDHFRHAISGGAKLPIEVFDFFASLEIPILEGYGLTETCVATHVNRVGSAKRGTVGPALRGVETQIAEDGEILVRGPNIAMGYYQKPEATAEAWDAEGWFHTGDIGALDQDGFLAITGRKKELLVTAGGKKIPTQKIENLLQTHSLISHAVLVGEGRPFCGALVTVDPQMLAVRAKQLNKDLPTDPTRCDWLSAELNAHLSVVNKELASFEQVKKIAILSEEFSIDNGLLTPTLKVRRARVVEQFAEQIEALYGPTS